MTEREVQRTSSLRPYDFTPNESFGTGLDRGTGVNGSGEMGSWSDYTEVPTEIGTPGSRASSADFADHTFEYDNPAMWDVPESSRGSSRVWETIPPRPDASFVGDTSLLDPKEQRLVQQVGMLQSLKDTIQRDISTLDRRRLDALHEANRADEMLRNKREG